MCLGGEKGGLGKEEKGNIHLTIDAIIRTKSRRVGQKRNGSVEHHALGADLDGIGIAPRRRETRAVEVRREARKVRRVETPLRRFSCQQP